MKSLLLVCSFLILNLSVSAQRLHKLIPRNSKVFVLMAGDKSNAVKSLEHWGYWKIVPKKDEADYTMKIVGGDGTYAEFIDKNRETIFITQSVTYGTRANQITTLIRKRIINDKN